MTTSGTIYDPIRQRKVTATPEEHVRQAIIKYLTDELHIPIRLMAVEYSLSHITGGNLQRADIMVWKPGQKTQLQPWLLVECKAPSVNLKESIEFQVSQYLKYFPSSYLMLSNGAESLYFELQSEGYSPISTLPYYSNTIK